MQDHRDSFHANVSNLFFVSYAVIAYLAGAIFKPKGVLNRSTQLRHSKVKYESVFNQASPWCCRRHCLDSLIVSCKTVL